MSKELAIIDLIARQTGQPLALADDAFFDANTRLIYTTDMLVENRHFNLRYFSPQDLGWKAAAVNISDIAAMGGQPQYLLISLGLPDSVGFDWIQAFYEGILDACKQFGCEIAGGDTVGSNTITINVTAIGECPSGHSPGRRYRAMPGDTLITTGFHGLSKVGLIALQSNQPDYEACKQAHLRPEPRVEAGLILSRKFERYALMDSSDGLADALIKIAQASNVTLLAEQSHIRIHPELAAYYQTSSTEQHQNAELWQTLLYGGEDFELIAAVPAVDEEILQHFQVIGRASACKDNDPGAWLERKETGERIRLSLEQTYQHFGSTHGQPEHQA
jgi:thiamine-monophosphate kinase